MSDSCGICRELLADALDLCVRARDMDARDRRQAELAASSDLKGWVESGAFERHVARHNHRHPQSPIASRSATVRLWEQDQYEADLAAWEAKARHHLMQGCALAASTDRPSKAP